MKHLKILGMAVVAAAALMAFVGASTASADVLCTTNTTNECASGWRVTKLVASQVGSAALKDTSGNTLDTCSGANVESEDTEGSETHEPGGALTALTWTGCTATTDTTEKGKLTVKTSEVGGVHVNTLLGDKTKVTINIAGVSCTFGTGEEQLLGNLTVGSPSIVHINAVVNKVEGSFLCPSTGRWEATFQITNHTGVWISKK